MDKSVLKYLVFLLCTTILLSCGNKEFRKIQIDLKEQGNTNCKNHLLNENKSIYEFIKHKESIMLLDHSDYWSEIDENKINKKHRVPKMYSHQFQLTESKWLNYEFYLMSDDKCKCKTDLSYYNSISEKLSIYEELLFDKDKISYIEEIGKSKFNNSFRLILFGEEDHAENITISKNRISIPKSALDWKYHKYSFLIASTNNKEEPLIYFNQAILIDLKNEKVLEDIKPIL